MTIHLIKTIMLALTGILLSAIVVAAHGYEVGNIEIHHPNSRATLPGAPVAGGYLKISNSGNHADRLVSVTSPRARKVQLHDMKMEGDIMRMGELPDGVEVPAGATVELKHGGIHVMFMELTGPFKEGDEIPATLNFEKTGAVDVIFKVGPPNATLQEHVDHDNAAH